MSPEMAINLGLALMGLIAVLLILILKELHNLSSNFEHSFEHSEVPVAPKAENYTPSSNQGITDEEVAAIAAVVAKLMPDKKIASIRVEG